MNERLILGSSKGAANVWNWVLAVMLPLRRRRPNYDFAIAASPDRAIGLEPGKLANLVVLTGNPLETLTNLKTVVMTMKRGRAFERPAFIPLVEADITDL